MPDEEKVDMPGAQRIVRFRREYNRWVANQTLEDYALRFTAKSARRWSPWRVANTAIGSISFLALEAIGGAITLNYGFTNAFWAIMAVGLVIFLTSLPVSFYAAKYGVDMDLLTRGAGFGYLGSTITSLIYASFTFIFFAIEAAIMALAFEMSIGLPLSLGYVLSALIVIPIVTHGITLISKFQSWTQPLWLFLMILPFVIIGFKEPNALHDWTSFTGRHGESAGSFNLLLFGAAASVAFSLIAQIGEQVDFLRFLPRATSHPSHLSWWVALISAGPGWIVLGILKLLAGSFLLFLCLQHEIPIDKVTEPTQMYLVAFKYVFTSPDVALVVTSLFVILSQLKINVTNAYAGSIAWSNFFARLTHSHPGRVVWLFFNVVIALLLMELGIFRALEAILGFYANVAIAWVGAIVADLVINKPLGLSPPGIEFKRAHLYDINPVGVGAMTTATVMSMAAYMGLFGKTAQALSPFIALAVSVVTAPLIAFATDGKFYLARQSKAQWQGRESIGCCVCRHRFESEDMAYCPAYSGPICSLCCSLDVRCADSCKTNSRLQDQIMAFLSLLLPPRWVKMLDSRLGHYLGVFILTSSLLMGIVGLVYYQETLFNPQASMVLQPLLKVFFILILVVGVVTWLFILTQESRNVAQEESTRQNNLLLQEIDAHRKTDAALKRAKEVAEAANLAKSRYMSGISHELRTPLNAIMGYAQLLSGDNAIPSNRRDAIDVIRRSGDHLSGLIDGLLDIAKIEAGKLMLSRDIILLTDFIDQLVSMFELQAQAKGIGFTLDARLPLPIAVRADEKRLRQIILNLLSNAIKFTDQGSVILRVSYKRQITVFEVIDTGPGIEKDELRRIFNPFERGRSASGVVGTGLGLTIAKLLTNLMGGDLTVDSEPGKGSTFRVKLMLSVESVQPQSMPPERRISGYMGARKTILIADDDGDHRRLMQDVLTPLGFGLLQASHGEQCIQLAQVGKPDLVLLDISMPGMDGWQVSRRLREMAFERLPIVLVSANVFESQRRAMDTTLINDFLVKPVDLTQLLQLIRKHLNLEWTFYGDETVPSVSLTSTPLTSDTTQPEAVETLSAEALNDLKNLGEIGHVRAIKNLLLSLRQSTPAATLLLDKLERQVSQFKLKQFLKTLEEIAHRE